MTKLLEKALKKVSKLPQDEQDAIASQILAELEDLEDALTLDRAESNSKNLVDYSGVRGRLKKAGKL